MINTDLLSYKVVVISVAISFFLGKYLLNDVLHIPYYQDGGFPLFKIHLYTYFLFGALIYLTGKIGIKAVLNIYLSNIYLVYYIFSVLVIILHGIYQSGFGGMAYVLDTLLVVALIYPFLTLLRYDSYVKILYLLSIFLIINSVIAIAEFILSVNFIPRSAPVYEFRSWALLSHPLNNALITASLAVFLSSLFRVSLAFFVFMFFTLALLSFGGRAATLIFVLIWSGYFLFRLIIQILMYKGISKPNFYILFFGSWIYIFFLIVFIQLGFGERILDGMYIDSSAQTRFDVFHVFQIISTKELLWGVPDYLNEIVLDLTGVETVENTWLGWIFQFGIIFTVPLFITLVLLLISLSRGKSMAIASIALFLFLCSANNSLSTKTPALFLFFVTLYCWVECNNHGGLNEK